jgi:outer membrane protein assembly factor BamB
MELVYVGTFGGYFYALNATTGATIWTHNTGVNIWSTAAVANGMVYFGCNDNNNVLAFNATTGSLMWNYTTGSSVWSSPAVVNWHQNMELFDWGASAFLPSSR